MKLVLKKAREIKGYGVSTNLQAITGGYATLAFPFFPVLANDSVVRILQGHVLQKRQINRLTVLPPQTY